MSNPTPLQAICRGALAGAAGTLAMDLFWYARHLAEGGRRNPISWEFGGPSEWDQISTPGQVGKRLMEAFTQRPLPARWARLTNNLMHWGYGVAWGSAFGVVAGSTPRRAGALAGPLFGAGVWGSDYVFLPMLGLYKPLWEYAPKELAPDLAAHLVYGTGTAVAFRAVNG